MKTLQYQGPRQLVLTECATPVPDKGEVLLQVKACGICGSDVHGYLGITGRRLPGVAMGHEFSAVVAATGEGAEKYKEGDRVVVQPIDACGECGYCLEGNNNLCAHRSLLGVLEIQGAMAEYVCVPEKLLIPLADTCSFEDGALAEPLTVAYAAVNKIDDYTGKTVLVIGAGMIGLCILEMLKIKAQEQGGKGPEKILVSDLSDVRLERALLRGADAVINPKECDYIQKIAEFTDGKMCDITIEAVGVEAAANQSIRALRKNGISIWTGVSQQEMTINMHDIVVSQRTVIGSMNYTHQEFREVTALLEAGIINTEGLITGRVPLEKAAEMFEELHEKPDEHLKVMIVS